MRVGSLFSGIGGLDLGLERAGMEVVWQVEVDDFCTRVLARHWPDVSRFRDVRECHGAGTCDVADTASAGRLTGRGRRCEPTNSPSNAASCGEGHLFPVDLICGGFPCQPVSHAGKRKGDTDERWLWPEMYRIVREVQPRWVLIENVPGLRSIDAGRLFRGILWDLSQAGFDAEWCALSAADVGAPHLRERVFVVANSTGNLRRASGDDRSQASDGAGSVADAEGVTGEVRQAAAQRPGRPAGGGVADAADNGQPRSGGTRAGRAEPSDGSWWAVEPNVGRVADGVPARVDRLRGLGNAVVPQVAEVIGRWIMEQDG